MQIINGIAYIVLALWQAKLEDKISAAMRG